MNILKKIKFNSTFLLFIFCFFLLTVGTTYAFLDFNETNSTVSGVGACNDVNYTGEEITGADLVSTTTYTEGASSIVTLSKDADCAIYTIAHIKINTNDTTTAPIDNIKALRYKVEKISGDGEILSGGDGFIDQTGEITLASVTLTENITTYKVYLWVDASLSKGYYNDKTYSGYIFAESEQTSTIGRLNAYATNIMAPSAQSDANLNFTQTSEASNTNGVYIRSGTENNELPIYYYRGNVNNNLIFAGFCWKVVRTTETGGLKLIYNGLPSNGQCNNTGAATTIGDKPFNENRNSPAYVGYMYGTPHSAAYKEIANSTQYVYGNGVNYSNGVYTLTNTKTATWSSVYENGLTNHHYTCFTTGTTCKSVYYIYNTTSTEAYYLTLTGVSNIETALSQMLDNNTYSSTIKGNNTTEGTLDYWYYTNIEQKGYSSYIEDTIWCNDRSIYSLGGFNPNGGSTYIDWDIDHHYLNASLLYASSQYLTAETITPSLRCSRNIDRFTVSGSNGNGALDYPVGLLTVDEIILAGADNQSSANSSYYLHNNYYYWSISPFNFNDWHALNGFVESDPIFNIGGLYECNVEWYYGVRPSISLKTGFSLTGNGNGTATNPYIVG